jgi:hypothetical protein
MCKKLLPVILSLIIPTMLSAQNSTGWKAGAAHIDITPDHPVRLSGYGSRTAECSKVAARIHANALGAYAVGCVHYAAITGRSPVGLAADIKERWGRGWWTKDGGWERPTPPSAEVIRRIQEIAWETVRAEPGLLDAAVAK